MCTGLGMRSLSPETINMNQICIEEGSSQDPIMFILGIGADPSPVIRNFAKEHVGQEKFYEVKMFFLMFSCYLRCDA